jgi:lipopolysaccharide transport system ATP-binding protein
MSKTVISVENLSKSYRLGQIGTGTLSRDLEVWWAKVRGKPNPLLKIGQTDHENQDGQTLWALQDVSFQVQQGEVLGIIGRNGAGKSTLLKILSRVTAPTSGQVKVKGRIASLLEVGTGFHPELTGRENIFLNGAILGMSKQEVQRKFDEIVSFAEVEKFVDTPVKRYSSGMYVRLAFAVAAHLESEILLVDEVLAVGDAEFQKKCLGKMGDVATNEGRTVLFVSHNMVSIQNLCGKSVLLRNGKIDLLDVTESVINLYERNLSLKRLNDDLSQFRPDWAKAFIQQATIKNNRNEETNSFLSGSEIIVEMHIKVFQEQQINNPVMGVAIISKKYGTVGKINTRISGFISEKGITNKAIFQLKIKNLFLTSGIYSLNLFLGDGLVDIDALLEIINFEIINTDIYKTGKLPQWDPGMIYLQPEWEIIYE